MRKLNYREIKYFGDQDYATSGRSIATMLHYTIAICQDFCPFIYMALHSCTSNISIILCFLSFLIMVYFFSLKLFMYNFSFPLLTFCYYCYLFVDYTTGTVNHLPQFMANEKTSSPS